jgi:DNA polymerase III delta subunit
VRIAEVEELRTAIEGGAVVPVVLLAGGDEAVRDGIAEVLVADLRRGGAPVDTVRADALPAKTDAWTRLAEAADAQPMFGEGTLVIVEGYDGAKVPEELKRFLAAPPAHVRLLLRCEKKLAGLGKAVAAVGRVIAPAELRKNELEPAAHRAARDAGISLDAGAAAALADLVGGDRARLEAAAAALAAFKGAGARIAVDDLRGLVSRTREPMPWDLGDAINDRDLRAAVKVAMRELADLRKPKPGEKRRGAPVLPILFAILRQARQLLIARDLVARRVPDAEGMKLIGIKSPFPYEKLQKASKAFTHRELEAFLRTAPALETAAKRGGVSDEAFLTDVLVRLLGPGRKARRQAGGGLGSAGVSETRRSTADRPDAFPVFGSRRADL